MLYLVSDNIFAESNKKMWGD